MARTRPSASQAQAHQIDKEELSAQITTRSLDAFYGLRASLSSPAVNEVQQPVLTDHAPDLYLHRITLWRAAAPDRCYRTSHRSSVRPRWKPTS